MKNKDNKIKTLVIVILFLIIVVTCCMYGRYTNNMSGIIVEKQKTQSWKYDIVGQSNHVVALSKIYNYDLYSFYIEKDNNVYRVFVDKNDYDYYNIGDYYDAWL